MERFTDDNFIQHAVMHYSGMITRIAFQHVKNKADAEDVMQEVFFRLLEEPPFEAEAHLKHWLIRVAIHRSKDRLRAKKRQNVAPLTDGYAMREEQTEVFRELQSLPEKDRNILYLFYYEGYSAKEIGDILGTRESAVFMRLTRAREKLRYFLEERV